MGLFFLSGPSGNSRFCSFPRRKKTHKKIALTREKRKTKQNKTKKTKKKHKNTPKIAPSTVRPLARDPRVLVGWPLPLGFSLDGRLLLARRGRVCV